MNYRTTAHAELAINERGIATSWIERALQSPERTEESPDGTHHFLCRIAERDDRVLRVVTKSGSRPILVVTVFFDRRIKDLTR